METTNTYLTTEQAIEESKKQDSLIPSEFLSTFPNNFGINLCAIKGFNIEMTEDKQYKSITVNFIPKIEIIDERIRKEIIQFLQLPHPQFVGKRNHEEWIAWLEKPKYTEEDLDKAYKCADEVQYRRGYEDAKKEIEKQGEQKFNDIHPIFRVGDYIRNKKTGDKVLIEQLDIATKVYCYVSYDGDVDVVKITSEAEADVVRQLYYLFNSYVLGDQYADRRADAEDKIKSALEGNGVLIIGRGCSSDECFWIINSKEGLINQLDNICSDNEPIFDR